jgi:hypothetical protein
MNDKPSTANIPTLSSYNFVDWSIQVEGYLKECNLYLFISEDEPPPVTPSEFKTFKSHKTKTSGVLQRTMGTANYSKFKTDTAKNDPFQMWKKLKAHYVSSSWFHQSDIN